ncbi:unnamed protein product [Lota lota]
MHDLIRLAKSWLTAAPLTVTYGHGERGHGSLQFVAKTLASQANPQSADQLVEGHQAALEVLRSGRPLRGEPTPRPKEWIRTEDHGGILARDGGTPKASPPRQHPLLNQDSRKCSEFGEPGHIAWTCPNHDVRMPTASASETTKGQYMGPVGVVPNLPVPVGRDSPTVGQYGWRQGKQRESEGRMMLEKSEGR